jgi:hypothetical protein
MWIRPELSSEYSELKRARAQITEKYHISKEKEREDPQKRIPRLQMRF